MNAEHIIIPPLWGFQQAGIDKTREEIRRCEAAARAKNRRPRIFLVGPCGSGKRRTSAHYLAMAAKLGKRCLFLGHTSDIVGQSSQELWDWKIPHGIIKSGEQPTFQAPIQVASKQTIDSWVFKRKSLDLPPFDLIVIDEGHHSLAHGYVRLMDSQPQAVVLLPTATPARGDGRGFGDIVDGMVIMGTYKELVPGGYLVPCRTFAPPKRPERPVGGIVETWLALAEDRPTVLFANTTDYSANIARQFASMGIGAVHIDDNSSDEERKEAKRLLESGEIKVICNVDLMTEGTDMPFVGCVVMAENTGSLVRYRQRGGRAGRRFEGKLDMILIDHAGSCFLHGLPTDDIDWELSTDSNIDKKTHAANRNKPTMSCPRCNRVFRGPECPGCGWKPIKTVTCPKCNCTFEPRRGSICPNCGKKMKKKGKEREIDNGLLIEVTSDQVAAQVLENYQRLWDHCLGVMANQGGTPGQAVRMFAARAKKKPWEVEGMRNLPRKSQWHQQVSDVFPNMKVGHSEPVEANSTAGS